MITLNTGTAKIPDGQGHYVPIPALANPAGTGGDMEKAVYDTDEDGVVDAAETITGSIQQSQVTGLAEALANAGGNNVHIGSSAPENDEEIWIDTSGDEVILTGDAVAVSASDTRTVAQAIGSIEDTLDVLEDLLADLR